jgi:hypothetical protein
MNVLDANLETSPQPNQPNSQAANVVSNKLETPNKQNETEKVKPRSLAEMFGNPNDESSLEIDLEERTIDDPNKPIDTIDRLIARNKLTPEQAYAIKVPMPNGAEPLTIGELKDKIADLVDHEFRVTEFDERRIRQEGELLKSQGELRDLLALLPKEALTPKVLEKLRTTQDQTVRTEKKRALEHIPTWSDEKSRNADIEVMQETLADYGFDESFLHSVIDHRAVKFIRDMCLMRARIRKSLELVRDPTGKNKKPSGKAAKPAVRPTTIAPRKVMATGQDKIVDLFKSKE